MVTIRRATKNDRRTILECFVALQAHERPIEPNRAEPARVGEPYVQDLFGAMRGRKTEILVAEAAAGIVGWVGVVTQHVSEDILEHDREFAYITDLIVLEGYRGRGIGHRLLAEAEACAAGRGARRLRVGVLAANAAAHGVYHSAGFRDYEVILEKQILMIGGDPVEPLDG